MQILQGHADRPALLMKKNDVLGMGFHRNTMRIQHVNNRMNDDREQLTRPFLKAVLANPRFNKRLLSVDIAERIKRYGLLTLPQMAMDALTPNDAQTSMRLQARYSSQLLVIERYSGELRQKNEVQPFRCLIILCERQQPFGHKRRIHNRVAGQHPLG
ncbi:hypothetical protein D3C78_1251290 [compost metagenome]